MSMLPPWKNFYGRAFWITLLFILITFLYDMQQLDCVSIFINACITAV